MLAKSNDPSVVCILQAVPDESAELLELLMEERGGTLGTIPKPKSHFIEEALMARPHLS
jgi:hypothetical protein